MLVRGSCAGHAEPARGRGAVGLRERQVSSQMRCDCPSGKAPRAACSAARTWATARPCSPRPDVRRSGALLRQAVRGLRRGHQSGGGARAQGMDAEEETGCPPLFEFASADDAQALDVIADAVLSVGDGGESARCANALTLP